MSYRKYIAAAIVSLLVLLPGCVNVKGIFPAKKQTIAFCSASQTQALAFRLGRIFNKANTDMEILVVSSDTDTTLKALTGGIVRAGSVYGHVPEDVKGLVETVIGCDAAVIIVNPANRVEDINQDNLAKVISGEIRNWKDIGGNDAPINLVVPDNGSPARSIVESILLNSRSKTIASDATAHPVEDMVRQAVAANANSIGILPLEMMNESVKGLKIDGASCSLENIKNDRYVLSKPVIYLTKGQPKGAAKKFLDFVTSPEGKEIVGNYYTPLQ